MQIVLEGADGSGKSTIAVELTKWLNEKCGVKAIHSRHPGATPLGKEIRKIVANPELSVDHQTRALLFAADNSAYMTSVLRPAMAEDSWMVADRNNYISSLAYQIADGCSIEALEKIHDATYPSELVPKIDLLLILRVSYETAKKRREARSSGEKAEHFEKQMASRDFFDRVSGAYDSLVDDHAERLLSFVHATKTVVAPEGTPRVLYIDANKPFDAVLADVQEAAKSLLHERVEDL